MSESQPATPAPSRLEHLPISFFAIVMGLAGLSIATRRIEQAFAPDAGASTVLAAVAATVFVVIAAFYAAKAVRHPGAVVAEWRHPVRIAFFPTVSISLLLLALTALPLSRPLATGLWVVGAGLHLCATLAVVSAWIGHRPFEAVHLNPAWFIPAVGNVVVPLAGTQLGHVEVSWFFFATGMVFWIILLTLVFNRLVFHNPLPDRLAPTLVILIAPPAVAFLSYLRLADGALDPFARVLFHAALVFFLVVATQARRFTTLPFALSWWAYSFPLAALTTATGVYAERIGSGLLTGAFIGFYVLLFAVIVVLTTHTVRAILAGEICKPEG